MKTFSSGVVFFLCCLTCGSEDYIGIRIETNLSTQAWATLRTWADKTLPAYEARQFRYVPSSYEDKQQSNMTCCVINVNVSRRGNESGPLSFTTNSVANVVKTLPVADGAKVTVVQANTKTEIKARLGIITKVGQAEIDALKEENDAKAEVPK